MKSRSFRIAGGVLLTLIPLVLWKWQPFGLSLPTAVLGYQLLLGIVMAAGLLLLGTIDLERLGSFPEVLIALLLGLLFLLFGRVWTGAGFTVPAWHDESWLLAVFPASLLGCLCIGLLVMRCLHLWLNRSFRGFDGRRCVTLLLIVTLACLSGAIVDWMYAMTRTFYKHTELSRWNAHLWSFATWFVQYLIGGVLLLFVRRNRPAGIALLAMGGTLMLIQIAIYHLNLWPGTPLHGILDYDNGTLYTALLFMGLAAVRRGKA